MGFSVSKLQADLPETENVINTPVSVINDVGRAETISDEIDYVKLHDYELYPKEVTDILSVSQLKDVDESSFTIVSPLPTPKSNSTYNEFEQSPLTKNVPENNIDKFTEIFTELPEIDLNKNKFQSLRRTALPGHHKMQQTLCTKYPRRYREARLSLIPILKQEATGVSSLKPPIMNNICAEYHEKACIDQMNDGRLRNDCPEDRLRGEKRQIISPFGSTTSPGRCWKSTRISSSSWIYRPVKNLSEGRNESRHLVNKNMSNMKVDAKKDGLIESKYMRPKSLSPDQTGMPTDMVGKADSDWILMHKKEPRIISKRGYMEAIRGRDSYLPSCSYFKNASRDMTRKSQNISKPLNSNFKSLQHQSLCSNKMCPPDKLSVNRKSIERLESQWSSHLDRQRFGRNIYGTGSGDTNDRNKKNEKQSTINYRSDIDLINRFQKCNVDSIPDKCDLRYKLSKTN